MGGESTAIAGVGYESVIIIIVSMAVILISESSWRLGYVQNGSKVAEAEGIQFT